MCYNFLMNQKGFISKLFVRRVIYACIFIAIIAMVAGFFSVFASEIDTLLGIVLVFASFITSCAFVCFLIIGLLKIEQLEAISKCMGYDSTPKNCLDLKSSAGKIARNCKNCSHNNNNNPASCTIYDEKPFGERTTSCPQFQPKPKSSSQVS